MNAVIRRGSARIRAAFAGARGEGRAAFIGYVVAGYPTQKIAAEAARAVLDAGADILEIGVPFSDPMADGPLIAAASRVSLEAGGGLQAAVQLAGQLRSDGMDQPLMVMSYLNPLLAHGMEEALEAFSAAGVDGLIVPDLPVDEDPAFERAVADHGLGISFLVAPNTPRDRLERAVLGSTAFVYVVPLFGVTGARDTLATAAPALIDRIATASAGRAPVAAGFGISAPDQVAQLAAVADGVVVGSALVRALADENGDGLARLRALVTELRAATTVPSGTHSALAALR
jgi:tryptophan synthase alpha chain